VVERSHNRTSCCQNILIFEQLSNYPWELSVTCHGSGSCQRWGLGLCTGLSILSGLPIDPILLPCRDRNGPDIQGCTESTDFGQETPLRYIYNFMKNMGQLFELDQLLYPSRTHPRYQPFMESAAIFSRSFFPILVYLRINTKCFQSQFYITMSPVYKDEIMDSLFTTRDPAHHKALKRPVAGKFSMTSIRTMEPFVNECSEIFVQCMKDLEGQKVDLGAWLQWYAFDVIGMITFNRRFGFMEERKDVLDMISSIESTLKYAGIVGQVPYLHPWLAGNQFIMRNIERIPFLHVPDPLRTIVEVSFLPYFSRYS
jgi:Cytochrome P450